MTAYIIIVFALSLLLRLGLKSYVRMRNSVVQIFLKSFLHYNYSYLAHLRRNRDEEERLMANVPGWVVGTYYGNPIYKSRPADEWHDVTLNEV